MPSWGLLQILEKITQFAYLGTLDSFVPDSHRDLLRDWSHYWKISLSESYALWCRGSGVYITLFVFLLSRSLSDAKVIKKTPREGLFYWERYLHRITLLFYQQEHYIRIPRKSKRKIPQKCRNFYLSTQVKRLKNCLSFINNSIAYFAKKANLL